MHVLENAGDWIELGGADEQRPAREGTVEALGLCELEQNPRGNRKRAR